MDYDRLLSRRTSHINGSGIRKIFELAQHIADPVNLSIGQPDFPVPERIKRAAIRAIEGDRNGYTLTTGIPELREAASRHLEEDLGWKEAPVLVTSGTSGALTVACLALLGPGDECVIPDPYFVAYPPLVAMCGATAVLCDTYPDLRMTAERVEPLITERTKFVLLNSPSNPAGVVASREECADLLDLCRRKNVLLISDEIYDVFTYSESRTDRSADGKRSRCPSPGRLPGAMEQVLVIRGLGKSYAVTGWRLGFASGPGPVIDLMARLQQFTFVCAPSMAQHGGVEALRTDVSERVAEYESRRDMVVERLRELTEVVTPGGAFYVFPKVPERVGLTASEFVKRAVERSLLVIPGKAFSSRDTHFRVSFATDRGTLGRGLEILADLLG